MIYNINGLQIETSNIGRSGYNAVTFSPVWTQDLNAPFIAEKRNPVNDPVLSEYLLQPNSDSVKLGYYADAREAAYVVAMYNDDVESVLKELFETGEIAVQFPKELYELPVYLTLEEAQEMIEVERIKRAPVKALKLKDVLEVARDVLAGKKIKNIPAIRKAIEASAKSKIYETKDDVELHIMEIAEMG